MKKYALNWLIIIFIFLLQIGIFSGIVYGNLMEKEYIYIDPGHGGFDGGAVSLDGETPEKNIVLKISFYLKENLEKLGYQVKLTRDKDCALAKTKKDDIYKRVSLINDSNAKLYISIHANAYPSSVVHGAQVFYKDSEENKSLSNNIQQFLKEIDKTNTRVSKSISGKYLLDHVKVPGCLVEVGFLSNETDLKNLQNDIYLQDTALMIYLGVIKHLTK